MAAPPHSRRIEIEDGFKPSWIAWSPDGTKIAHGYGMSPGVAVRDVRTGEELSRWACNSTTFHGSWSPDGTRLAVTEDGRLSVWDWKERRIVVQKRLLYTTFAHWHPTEEKLAINDTDGLKLLDSRNLDTLVTHPLVTDVFDAAWAGSSGIMVGHLHGLTGFDTRFRLFLSETKALAVTATESLYANTSDQVIVVGNHNSRTDNRSARTLEHHESYTKAVTFSPDGALLAGLDEKGIVAVWRAPNWDLLYDWRVKGAGSDFYSLKFAPAGSTLACTTERSILFFDLIEARVAIGRSSILYTTAKIVLVGDSGVGKTGLAWVLTHDSFKEHSSTHGEQFWIAERLSGTRTDGVQCEAVVWDLAGQPDYRLIHSLFVDDADVALVVFDPTNRQEPLKGAEFWLRALGAAKSRKCRTILVGARIDRGTGILTDDEIAAFARAHGVDGGYIATSAITGQGVRNLIARVGTLVGWEERQATLTLQTFKDIKDHVLAIKEGPPSDVLVTLVHLRANLRERTGTQYTLDDIFTATKHLSDHGYVRHLRSNSGNRYVLLAPDLLNNLAASIILDARRNPKGLGALEERRVLGGDYEFPELAQLMPDQREILLNAATTLFIEHHVCFRETLGRDTYLVFPSLINQNRPPVDDLRTVEATAYTAIGATENVYASLVVLLGYTNTFSRTNHWRNEAQYEMGEGQVGGFRLAEERDGEIDLVLYFSDEAAPSTRQLFQGLFEKFLLARDVEVQIFPPVECPECRYAQPRSEVIKRQREQANAMFCSNCGKKMALPERILTVPVRTARADVLDREQRTAAMRTQFEKAITWLKSFLHDKNRERAPSCFVSYAWGDPSQERWIERHLATDVRNAGVEVILDRWHNKPGASISRFIEQIDSVDFVVMIGTPRLREKYDSKSTDPVVAAELKLINTRLRKQSKSEAVLPLLLEGEQATSFPPLAEDSVFIDFRNEDDYFERMFDLLLTLYRIQFDEPAMRDIRDTIREAADRRRRR